MGKSWKHNAKNENWRRKKQEKWQKKSNNHNQPGRMFEFDPKPFDDRIGGTNDYAYGM